MGRLARCDGGSEERSAHRRDLWLPALMGLVAALVALGAWGLLVVDRHEQLLDATRETAAETRAAVERRLAEQVDLLRALGRESAEFGLRPIPEWKAPVFRM